MKNHGFSLVELSIVLVILGLLTGGILAGQSLIRASELRSVSVDYSRYVAAVQSFRDKYSGFPGDFKDASRYWGRMNSNSDCVTNSSAAVATPGACDGNADGSIVGAAAASQSGESFQFWRMLANAGLIEGSYTGLAGPSTANWVGNDAVLGTNVPRSKMSNAGWGMITLNSNGDSSTYKNNYGNMFIFGAQNTGNYPVGSALKPEEAWNIDTKMDDGKPGSGKIWAWNWSACTTSASNTDYTGAYAVSTTSLVCSLWFASAF